VVISLILPRVILYRYFVFFDAEKLNKTYILKKLFLQKNETTCGKHDLQRKKDALNFTYRSQKLLFEDNIQEMKQLRYEK